MYLKTKTDRFTSDCSDEIQKLQKTLAESDAVIIGAGAGLSTAAGFTYSGERFRKYFSDFEEKYGFHDMYSGGFYPYETPEEHWAFWSRYIYVNRYMDPPGSVYSALYEMVKEKDYFVLTTNVDHCFQKAGFAKNRLFYTQGDYGLFQCGKPCCPETFDNEERIRTMLEEQGFAFGEACELILPEQEKKKIKMRISSHLVPRCPRCGRPMTMNLRADTTFAEDAGWKKACDRYSMYLRRHRNTRMLLLELGVGYNTPGIIKYPFWQMTAANPQAVYACINKGQAFVPADIAARSVCIDMDIAEALDRVLSA